MLKTIIVEFIRVYSLKKSRIIIEHPFISYNNLFVLSKNYVIFKSDDIYIYIYIYIYMSSDSLGGFKGYLYELEGVLSLG